MARNVTGPIMLPNWTHIFAAILPDNPDVSDETARRAGRGSAP